MKRLWMLMPLVVLLNGCGQDPAMEAAMELRGKALGAAEISFRAEITADYIDTVEEFGLDCRVDQQGNVAFEVCEPEEISGIRGTVSGEQGTLDFADTVLGFPLMAQGRLSPVSAPWVVAQALRSGYIVCCVQEEGLLHLTIDQTYADDALTVDLWTDNGAWVAAEISWDGIRQVSMEIESYDMG